MDKEKYIKISDIKNVKKLIEGKTYIMSIPDVTKMQAYCLIEDLKLRGVDVVIIPNELKVYEIEKENIEVKNG